MKIANSYSTRIVDLIIQRCKYSQIENPSLINKHSLVACVTCLVLFWVKQQLCENYMHYEYEPKQKHKIPGYKTQN
jgi:hypothetical protein